MPPSPRGQHPQALCAALAHGLNAVPVAICLVNLQAAVCVWRVNIDLLPPQGLFFFPSFPLLPEVDELGCVAKRLPTMLVLVPPPIGTKTTLCFGNGGCSSI